MAILLAAGAGSRFGGGKLLHPLDDGVAIAAHAARNLIAAGLEVTAVIRPGDFPLRELLEQEGCSVTVCSDAALGMGVSLSHGVRMTHDAAGWIVALADMPRIRPDTIARVVQVLMAGADIVAPAYQGDCGHPVAFGRRFLHELQLLGGDSGARASFYQQMLSNGVMTINEVRALENLAPVPGGEVPRMQMQNVPITQISTGAGSLPPTQANAPSEPRP